MPSFTTDMEKGHFGDGVDHGKVNTIEYPLDFGDMLHTADGALHHQTYEFFQPGPATRQGDKLDSTFQESTFPFPSNYLAAAPNFHYLHEGTLQTAGTNAVEERIRDSRPHLRSTQSADRLHSHIQRNEFKAAGFAPGHELLTSMETCIDQLYSDLGKPTFQYASEKSSLVHTTHELAHMIPDPRGFSGYETFCSPNNLKRASSCEIASTQPRHRGIKSQKVMVVPDHGVLKTKRPTDQAEHVLRERIRRDDMTSKFRMLESLIPPGPKRDRATIVEDSIQYLKNLHHRLKDLEQKRSEIKSSCTPETAIGHINAPGPALFHVAKKSSRPGIDKVVSVDNNIVSSPSEPNDMAALANTSIEKVEVHLDLPHEIVIEMTCRSHGKIQSQILIALERLRMDLLRCSISNLHGRIMCVVVVKVLLPYFTSFQFSGATILTS
ncbi:hypothetical protein KC19_10G005900 [Ceratodon purpureus]|uniref:BHLH domain-containing protein n=1 Tax=Ceratodon purpureus TaxID=3225 RepID=A0A8T0GK70_CERPU|nr:hypothetical protein KC19_10G005900 [Ceratodon purpureus]